MVPRYLTMMCRPVAQSVYLAKNRSAARGHLLYHRWNTVSYGQRCFQYSAPVIWNSLPNDLRSKQSLTTIRRDLKTNLFRQAYLTI